MRGYSSTVAVLLSSLLISGFSFANSNTFVESCLGDTGILQKQLVCGIQTDDQKSMMSFTLDQGQELKVQASGQFGSYNKNLDVGVIAHLPPRLTDEGAMGESLQFTAKGGLFNNIIAVITVPCHQANYAVIGIGKVSGSELPSQITASCQLK